jgi:enterochelin esterase-like enzyme
MLKCTPPAIAPQKAIILSVFFLFSAILLIACAPVVSQTSAISTTPPATLAPTTIPTPFPPAPTATSVGCQEHIGTTSTVNVPSKLLKQPIELKVYTPPCYSASKPTRYPVLYMLHGQTYDDMQWPQLGLTAAADKLIATGQISPFIIVMPNETASMSDADSSKFGDALINEVIPWVDTNYATCDVRQCRAIGGLSRGGNWAVRIGMSHPDYFAAIGAHSAPLFYGDLNQINTWVSVLPAGEQVPMIYIDFGKSDEERDQMLQFDQELSSLGVVHQMVQFDGFHNADYWSAHVEQYLLWYSASLASPQG